VPNVHASNAIPWRPPAGTDLRDWLRAHSEETGRAVNAVITQAVTEHRERCEHPAAGLALTAGDAQALLRHAVASMTELQHKAKDDPVFLPSARSAADFAVRLRRFMLDNPGCGFALRVTGGERSGD
jgi:hypothetical protein